MDTSKEFILMSEKAVEIQKIHDFKGVAGSIGISYSKNNVYFGKEITYNALKIIWLPRQSQLQGVVGVRTPIKDIFDLYFWIDENRKYLMIKTEAGLREQFTSMEQLWLAFVMKEKYNKVWEGEEWKVK